MKDLSRRSFLQNLGMSAGATTLALALPSFATLSKKESRTYPGKKLNVALCGLGNYAGMLAYGLEQSQYCSLAGIVTGHPAKAEEWKKQYNIPEKNIYNYQNFDKIRNNEDIDLVYVVLPNALHKEFTIRAARAGKHVITEKPMSISTKDCEAMIKACKDAGVQLAVGYRLHYEPYHLEIKRLGQKKIFGQVRLIEASLGYKSDDPTQWRLKKAIAGGGPLMDLGIYCIQSSRYVLGEEPISVTAQFGPNTNKKLFSEVEASINWQMNFPGGAVCSAASSYNYNVDRFFASADEGQFEMSPGLSYGPFKGKTSNGELNFPEINQQATQLDAIGKLIIENKYLPSHITGEEGLKDIKIIEAVYAAARSGKKIMIG
ncbi:MAG: Gfo/Idh/MocA family oxidoreductase [Chitinophagaceae bacterium]|nr:Gfo/Idh/MocA family oxidoreductase [Chitinophagaceae bacterium]